MPFFDRSTAAVGTFVTKLIAFAATRGGRGGEVPLKGITEQTKLSSRQVQRVKRCTATTQYCFLFLGLFPLWSEDKEPSITASVCNLRIPLWANTIRSAFTLNSPQKLCQGTNLLHLPLNTFIKGDKSRLETYYQTVPTSTVVRARKQAEDAELPCCFQAEMKTLCLDFCIYQLSRGLDS